MVVQCQHIHHGLDAGDSATYIRRQRSTPITLTQLQLPDEITQRYDKLADTPATPASG